MVCYQTVVLDAELTAWNSEGVPDFRALLHKSRSHLCVWVFDILYQRERDLRTLPLVKRRERLDALMARVHSDVIQCSATFSDATALLTACTERNLEGIVSKRADAPYRSGPSADWVKVKCPAWRGANQWRHEFFAR